MIRTVVANKYLDPIMPVLPWLSILGIGGVVFPAVANSADLLASVGLIVFVAVLMHNVLGYVLGYFAGRLFRLPEKANRTMAVEIGTQSAGLASGMAGRFFSPEAALPGAVAAVIHNITGAVYSAIVRNRALPEDKSAADASGDAAEDSPGKV